MRSWRATIRKLVQQPGFTLIELTIVLALVGLVGTAIMMSIYQVYGINSSTMARVTAQNQVAFATKWINDDVNQAQIIITSNSNPLGDSGREDLILKWEDWENTGYTWEIRYRVNSRNELVRQEQKYNKNGTLESDRTAIIAYYISSDTYATCCAYKGSPNDIATLLNVTGDYSSLTFKITANVTGQRPTSAISIVRIVPKSIRMGAN
jgi:prepilin-type N-terminal cleavage/methylation domain-containing protein